MFASSSTAHTAQSGPNEPLRLVLIDQKTEAELGPFPYDRSKIAQAITLCHKAGAKGVILKYFFDQPKSQQGDDALAAAMKLLPVLLQARLDPSEPNSNPLPTTAVFQGFTGTTDSLMNARSGWLPLPRFALNARAIGFVDMRNSKEVTNVPTVELYRNQLVPSLTLASLELLLGRSPQIQSAKSLTFLGKTLPLNSFSEATIQLPTVDDANPISFVDLLNAPPRTLKLSGQYIVLGYEGDRDPKFQTTLGQIGAHRLFYYGLRDLYRRLK